MSDIVTNEFGGKQSHIGGRYDLIPPHALETVAYVLGEGAKKYGTENWKRITTNEHINHTLNHINLFFIGDEDENHLGHAIVRLMMAYEVDQLGVKIDASPSPRKDPTNQPSFEEAFSDAHNWGIE